MLWKKFRQGDGAMGAEQHFGGQVRRIDLPDELSAPAAWWQDMKHGMLVSPHGDDLRDPVFASCDHRCDRGGFRAQTRSGTGIDAHSRVHVPGISDECGRDVSEALITQGAAHRAWAQDGRRSCYEFLVAELRHSSDATGVQKPRQI
jgi:hypothetical protein